MPDRTQENVRTPDLAPESLQERSGEISAPSTLPKSPEPLIKAPKTRAKVAVVRLMGSDLVKSHEFAKDVENQLYRYDAKNGLYVKDGNRICEVYGAEKLGTKGYGTDYSRRVMGDLINYVTVKARRLWDTPGLARVNLKNGIYNLVEHKLEPHDSDFLSPVQLNFSFDQSAICPTWDRYSVDIFLPDCQHIPAQMLAWLIIPNTNLQKVLLFVGKGRNGKSILCDSMITGLGKQNCSNRTLTELEQNRFAPSSLVGKLANFCGDLPLASAKESYIFKATSGQDIITVERKNQDAYEIKPFARLVASSNHLPKCTDTSEGWFRRWIIVPMERQFLVDPRKDKTLRYDLTQPGELSGLFNKCLEQFGTIMDTGFTISDSMRLQEARLRIDNGDPAVPLVEEFLEKYYFDSPNAKKVTGKALYAHWQLLNGESVGKSTFNNLVRFLKPNWTAYRATAGLIWIGAESKPYEQVM